MLIKISFIREKKLFKLGNSQVQLNNFREMKTRIHDLESDYYNMENNIYLTREVSVFFFIGIIWKDYSVFNTLYLFMATNIALEMIVVNRSLDRRA